MINYFKSKTLLVRSVVETINNLKPGSVSTTTIVLWPSGGYSVRTATEELLDVTEEKLQTSSSQPTGTSSENTQDG